MIEFRNTDGVVHPRNSRIDDIADYLVRYFDELPISRLWISILLAHGQTRQDIYEIACDIYCESQDEIWSNVVEYSWKDK